MTDELPEQHREAFPLDAEAIIPASSAAVLLVFEPPNMGTGTQQADATAELTRPFLMTGWSIFSTDFGESVATVELWDAEESGLAAGTSRLLKTIAVTPGEMVRSQVGETHNVYSNLYVRPRAADGTSATTVGRIAVSVWGRAPS